MSPILTILLIDPTSTEALINKSAQILKDGSALVTGYNTGYRLITSLLEAGFVAYVVDNRSSSYKLWTFRIYPTFESAPGHIRSRADFKVDEETKFQLAVREI